MARSTENVYISEAVPALNAAEVRMATGWPIAFENWLLGMF